MLHRIILVLTLLVAVSCTGDDTVIRETFCPTLDRVLMEDETCPDPDPPPVTAPPTTAPPDDDRGGPTRADCTPVQGINLVATSQDDVICGNERDNEIQGLTGDDTIYGGAGNDTLIGGDDRDILRGEAGNDTLRGGQDNDILDGGEGTDTADYSKENFADLNDDGTETFNGSPVVVNLAENHARDTYGDDDTLEDIENVIGTSGTDTITGDSSGNKLDGQGGVDTINGGAGNDVIIGGADGDTLDGGAGEDTLSYENEKGATATTVTIDLAANTAAGGTGGSAADTITEDSFENITGGDADDALTGDERANKLSGGGGADTLIGNLGRDTLTGGTGGDCFIVDARNASAGDAETITDFNKEEDAITVCGPTDAAAVGSDALPGEKLLRFSGNTIQRLTSIRVADDTSTTDVNEAKSPVYLSVATLSGSSTRLTATEITDLGADVARIGDSTVTCTCPSN